jgi:hypothetical protein
LLGDIALDVALDVALVDGALVDGALVDGALVDGALVDGALGDGALGDGALGDGALVDVALVDVALVDVALGDGALGDGALGDGALVDLALVDVALASPRWMRCPSDGNSPEARAIAASSGSAFITMPGPPPYGVSSTVRCLSFVKSRGLTVSTVITPASRARPTTPPAVESSARSISSGRTVTTENFICSRATRADREADRR